MHDEQRKALIDRIKAAAKLLGISRPTMRYRVAKYDIPVPGRV